MCVSTTFQVLLAWGPDLRPWLRGLSEKVCKGSWGNSQTFLVLLLIASVCCSEGGSLTLGREFGLSEKCFHFVPNVVIIWTAVVTDIITLWVRWDVFLSEGNVRHQGLSKRPSISDLVLFPHIKQHVRGQGILEMQLGRGRGRGAGH